MKIKIGIACLFVLFSISSFSQDFEGFIRYGMRYEITYTLSNPKKVIKKNRLEKNDSVLISYTKDGDFLKYIKNIKLAIYMYKKNANRVYTFYKADKEITVTDPLFRKDIPPRSLPKVKKIDSVKTINNIQCEGLQFDYGYYKSTVYFSRDEKYKGLGKVFFY